MIERRNSTRWKINKQAKVKLEGAHKFAGCNIDNVSLKGLKFTLPLKLPKDKFLKLTLALSEAFVLDVEGWVAWHKTIDRFNCYGLYFSKIKNEDKEKIYQFVRKNSAQQLNKQWQQSQVKEGGEIMQEEKFEDRRIFERFASKMPVRFIDLKENRESDAVTEDLSAKGVSFTTKEQLRPRTPLEMWLKIPDKGEPLYTRGEVVWSKMVDPDQYKVGVILERANLMGLSRALRLV